jgi:RecA/RadA recombinase
MIRIRKKTSEYLSTGCTLLNLAISDSPWGGYPKGKYTFLVGDSASGKTFFTMTALAEATRNPAFSNHRFIHDDPEGGMAMDVVRLFGPEVLKRLESPGKEEVSCSNTVEEFYYHLDDAFKEGRPFIYILDSMDALESEDDVKKFGKRKKAHREGGKEAGTYGLAKAKANSVGLRGAKAGLRGTDNILIIVSQTRVDPNKRFGSPKTRGGGKALRFYSHVEVWTALGGQIKKTVRKQQRRVGDKIKINLKKNRVTGKLHEVWTAIYPSYGIDDIGSNIDYLLRENWWKKRGQKIVAGEFRVEGKRDTIIQHIEQAKNGPQRLQTIVGKCWASVAKACELDRRSRY